MFNKIKSYIPKFLSNQKPERYLHYMRCFRLNKTNKDLKHLYDVRFSLLVQSMLRANDSISKEGLAEVNMFMTGLLKEIENGSNMYVKNSENISDWCVQNNIKIDN